MPEDVAQFRTPLRTLAVIRAARALSGKRASIAGLLLSVAIAASAALLGWAQPLDHGLRAIRDTLRSRPASPEFVLVEIDARSLAAVDRWPWPRRIHARAVDALRKAGAATIAFDVDFSARSNAADDAALAAALRRAGSAVILPTFRQAESQASARFIDSMPIAELRAASFAGAVTIVPDPDGVVRSAPLAVETEGAPRPSLAALLAGRATGQQTYFAIDYATDPASIVRASYVDLLEGRVAPDVLRGKRVLIGATAVEMGDRYATPRHGVLPGAVIQLIAADTLGSGRVPVTFGPWLALAAAIVALAIAQRGRAGALVVAGVALPVVPLVTQTLGALDLQIAPALLAIVLGGAWLATVRVMRGYVARSVGHPGTGLPNTVALALDERKFAHGEAAVMHVGNAAEIAAALDGEVFPDLCRKVADRVALVAGGTVYQIDEASFGWMVAPADSDAMAERFDSLSALFRTPIEAGGRRIDIAPVFGIASEAQPRRAISHAALAAKRAEAEGVRWQRYSTAGDDADWRIGMLGELDEAIEAGDVFVLYQPKYDLRSDRVTAAEALVRWHHPQRGLVPPDDFIAFAENGGRIETLTALVLRDALAAMTRCDLAIAVNISAALLVDDRVVTLVEQALAASSVAPARLTLEITESAAIQRTDTAVAILHELKALGVRISIDDYGTGQSTLDYLKRLPASELKIDKSFVQSMLDSRSDTILVASTINLALELGLEVVAEGVENAELIDRLRTMGCSYAQGFHIGRPMALEALLDQQGASGLALAA